MNKTKIEWTDYTWNPIKGICPVGCWYCYAQKYYKRFHLDKELRGDENEIVAPLDLKTPSRIFVCSTMELFHPKIEKHWRDTIFEAIRICSEHTFQILTKLPQNIDRPMPDNVWLGVSVTKNEEEWKIDDLLHWGGQIRFLSVEPMLDDCRDIIHSFDDIEWLIIGQLTGHGKKYSPQKEWINYLVDEAQLSDLPIFMKDNLKEIWGEPLIQEFPKIEDE